MVSIDQPVITDSTRLLARIGDDWRKLAAVRRTAYKWRLSHYRATLRKLEKRGLVEFRNGEVRRRRA